jgi:DNA polymerase III sliding clamp (beta) subunit (PCNA family)
MNDWRKNMDRKDLLGKLELVAPALSDINLIQSLTHVLFKGDRVLAYNDRIALETPLKTDFRGAVPGLTLIALLKTSGAKDVVLEPKDNVLHIQAGRGRFKLPLLAPDTFPFEMPGPVKEITEGRKFKVELFPKTLLDAIDNCMRSVSIDTSVPDQLGVTLIPVKEQIKLFATNNNTLSHSILPGKLKQRVILPAQFCEQLLKLCKNEKQVALTISDDHAMLKANGTTLFGKLISSKNPLGYDDILSHHMPDKLKLFDIPIGLKNMLERATIITESAAGRTSTAFTVTGGDMKLFSKSDKGEVLDRLKIEQSEDVAMSADPKLVKSGLDKFKKMAVTDDCIIMKERPHHYLVAAAVKA